MADGEIIGTWHLIDDVFYAFTPNGATEQLFFEAFLWMLFEMVVLPMVFPLMVVVPALLDLKMP